MIILDKKYISEEYQHNNTCFGFLALDIYDALSLQIFFKDIYPFSLIFRVSLIKNEYLLVLKYS